MDNSLIVFGPWMGEISYEMGWWVPQIRKVKNDFYPNLNAISISYPGRKRFYSDFSDFLEYDEDTLYNMEGVPDGCNVLIKDGKVFRDSPVLNKFIKKHFGYTNIIQITTNNIQNHCPVGFVRKKDTTNEMPWGEYINLSPSKEATDMVSNILSTNTSDKIALMARVRYRNGIRDGEDWNDINWKILVDRLISDLNVTIVPMVFGYDKNSPGSLSFKENDNIIVFNNPSIDEQLAILKQTKCSYYGGTGAAMLPIFANTPMFTHQTKDNGYRLSLSWQKLLTNGHKNIKIFDRYSKGSDMWNTPIDEILSEFKNFYSNLQ